MHDIFVSKPSKMMNDIQTKLYDKFQSVLDSRRLRLRSLGTTDYSNKAPLFGVLRILKQCRGIIILGMRQTCVMASLSRDGTSMGEFYLPTEWNNLEAGIAFALKLPMLIICENGIGGGVFDRGVTDLYIHHDNLPTENIKGSATKLITKYFESEQFLQPFKEWYRDVVLFASKRKHT